MATNRLPQSQIDIVAEDRRLNEAKDEIAALLKIYMPLLEATGNEAAAPELQEVGRKIADAVEREAEAFIEILGKLKDGIAGAREHYGFENGGIDHALRLHACLGLSRASMSMIFHGRSGRNPEAN